MVALPDLVIFPHLIVPLLIDQERVARVLEDAMKGETGVVVVAQRCAQTTEPARRDLYGVGTFCQVLQVLRLPEGGYRVALQGVGRARLVRTVEPPPNLRVQVRLLAEPEHDPESGQRAMKVAMSQFRQAVERGKSVPSELVVAVLNIEGPGHLADIIGFHLDLDLPRKQALLQVLNPVERLKQVSQHLSRELEILKIEYKIQSRAEREMERGQREYFLRQQLKAIQQELGGIDEDDEVSALIQAVRESGMPSEAEAHALRELRKMERTPPAAAEYTVLHTYLDWLLQFPWSRTTEDEIDLGRALSCLDRDHYGLEEVKDRILEFLAVRKLAGAHKGPILCLVGPPGVGKTSLGRSIATALGRKFGRASLGGVRDEAEIRGHRRTYVGALPGRIIQALCTAGSRNPVLMLDEIDKLGMDFRGDPSAALLEALDPEQNREFKDHYLGITVDLSEVMFILTANLLDPIPPALRDRMEVLRLPGYTEQEKIKIANGHLLPRARQEHGLTRGQLPVDEDALRKIIREYTREAGVRDLGREVARLCRKRARALVEQGPRRRWGRITPHQVGRLLGVARYPWGTEDAQEGSPGSARGLSWTQYGGEVLTVEATLVPGRGRLVLTGSLGEVMKESARAAATWVRRFCQREAVDIDFYRHDIHLHVPAGATPKDGPSAGITMACALYTAVTGKVARTDVVMTGELNLRGQVMAVGGIKEKVLGAHNAGASLVLLPSRNRRHLEEVPQEVRQHLRFVFVERMEEVLAQVIQD